MWLAVRHVAAAMKWREIDRLPVLTSSFEERFPVKRIMQASDYVFYPGGDTSAPRCCKICVAWRIAVELASNAELPARREREPRAFDREWLLAQQFPAEIDADIAQRALTGSQMSFFFFFRGFGFLEPELPKDRSEEETKQDRTGLFVCLEEGSTRKEGTTNSF